jgi:CheY-like chemotaxis protein
MLAAKPRILLVEDDAITREVVQAHLSALGCRVDAAVLVSQAIEIGSNQAFDALVLDCQLGDGDAQTVLQALRTPGQGPNQRTAAVAMSAELDDARFDALIEAGFADAMEKPIHRSRLRHALTTCGVTGLGEARPQSASETLAAAPILDDAAGIQACGSSEVLIGLRLLLAQELPMYRTQLDTAHAARDDVILRACVHRMKSALGFCGAKQLLSLLDQSGLQTPDAAVLESWQLAIDRLLLQLTAPTAVAAEK